MNIPDKREEPHASAEDRSSMPNPNPSRLPEREDILGILRHILDPELGINIVDLGLIYEVHVSTEGAHIRMTMTTPGCPMHESIVSAAERALKASYPAKMMEVELVWEPPWTMDRLSPAARMQLGA